MMARPLEFSVYKMYGLNSQPSLGNFLQLTFNWTHIVFSSAKNWDSPFEQMLVRIIKMRVSYASIDDSFLWLSVAFQSKFPPKIYLQPLFRLGNCKITTVRGRLRFHFCQKRSQEKRRKPSVVKSNGSVSIQNRINLHSVSPQFKRRLDLL